MRTDFFRSRLLSRCSTGWPKALKCCTSSDLRTSLHDTSDMRQPCAGPQAPGDLNSGVETKGAIRRQLRQSQCQRGTTQMYSEMLCSNASTSRWREVST